MLHTGISTNFVHIFSTEESYTRTRMDRSLSHPLSFDSSIIKANFSALHILVTPSSKDGPNTWVSICVVFVRLHENFAAVPLSGNISFTSSVKWSATDMAKFRQSNSIPDALHWDGDRFVLI